MISARTPNLCHSNRTFRGLIAAMAAMWAWATKVLRRAYDSDCAVRKIFGSMKGEMVTGREFWIHIGNCSANDSN